MKHDKKPLRVLHLSGAIPKEGAGAAALLTHEALLRRGLDSRILFLKDPQADNERRWSFAHLSRWHRLLQLAVTMLERAPVALYRQREDRLFSTGFIGLRLDRLDLFRWADVIHLHWVNHGLVDIAHLARWGKPLVWTLRDMWAFTGGCHHALHCKGYLQHCGQCPLLGSARRNDLSSRGLTRKTKYLQSAEITWVGISRWLRDAAHASSILNRKNIRVVASGIRSTAFRPGNITEARHALGIPVLGKVVLLGANNLREKYKGFSYALDALRSISEPIHVVTFGRAAITQAELHHPVINLGYVDGTRALSEVYSAADVFLAPSVGEAFGKTFAEAQACGLPVVCFADTGPADIVEHSKTGYLARHSDTADLISGLVRTLGSSFDRDYISRRARREFDIDDVAAQYADLYEQAS